MNDEKTNPVEIDEANLDDVSGGLPAVQKVREAAARSSTAGSDVTGDGKADVIIITPTLNR